MPKTPADETSSASVRIPMRNTTFSQLRNAEAGLPRRSAPRNDEESSKFHFTVFWFRSQAKIVLRENRSGHQVREHRKRSEARFAARPESKDGEMVEPSGIEPLTSTLPVLRSPS